MLEKPKVTIVDIVQQEAGICTGTAVIGGNRYPFTARVVAGETMRRKGYKKYADVDWVYWEGKNPGQTGAVEAAISDAIKSVMP